MQEIVLVLLSLTCLCGHVDANIPTYTHPSVPTQQCYKCPPGFRIGGFGKSAKACPITANDQPSFPVCHACPEGYYSDS